MSACYVYTSGVCFRAYVLKGVCLNIFPIPSDRLVVHVKTLDFKYAGRL